jgi:hypothetical protein
MQSGAYIGMNFYPYTLNPDKLLMVKECIKKSSCIDIGKLLSASKHNVKLRGDPLQQSVTVSEKVRKDNDGLMYSAIKKNDDYLYRWIGKYRFFLAVKFTSGLDNHYITLVKG